MEAQLSAPRLSEQNRALGLVKRKKEVALNGDLACQGLRA